MPSTAATDAAAAVLAARPRHHGQQGRAALCDGGQQVVTAHGVNTFCQSICTLMQPGLAAMPARRAWPTIFLPPEMPTATCSEKLQSRAKGAIGRSVSDEFIEHEVNTGGGAEAWDALAALFVKSSVERRMELKAKLNELHKEPGESIPTYIARVKMLKNNLKGAGDDKMPEEDFVFKILAGLSRERTTVRQLIISTMAADTTIDALQAKLRQQEYMVARQEEDSQVGQAAFTAAKEQKAARRDRRHDTCNKCGKEGHWARDSGEKNGGNKHSQETCNKCGKEHTTSRGSRVKN
jgi:hypothetical protein